MTKKPKNFQSTIETSTCIDAKSLHVVVPLSFPDTDMPQSCASIIRELKKGKPSLKLHSFMIKGVSLPEHKQDAMIEPPPACFVRKIN